MEFEEFKKAYQFGVDSGGHGITEPRIFGRDTTEEAKRDLWETCSTPIWNETHVYRLRGYKETDLVGINAKSKNHADKLVEMQKPAGIAIDEYLGELSEIIDD